jgi:type IV pilus assembly protein PilQ
LIDIPDYPGRYQVNLPAAVTNAATLGMSFLTSNLLLDLELSALEAEGEGEIISTPRVVTANQAEAFIKQGVEIPYEESTSSGATAVLKDAVWNLSTLITLDDSVVGLAIEQDRGRNLPDLHRFVQSSRAG